MDTEPTEAALVPFEPPPIRSRELVHVPRAEFVRPSRARRARRRRIIGGACSVAMFASGVTFLAVGQWDRSHAAPQWQDPTPVSAPPTTVPVTTTLPAPVGIADAVTVTQAKTILTVDLPNWSGPGELYTDGVTADRVAPGQRGRSIVVLPVDPTGAATFNLAGRQWRVVTRGDIPTGALEQLIGPQPVVPTVVLVGANTNPWKIVEAR